MSGPTSRPCIRMAREPARFTLPTSRQRLAIMGHTGCGKTQQAVWALSNSAIESMPWIVFDYKGDDLINDIPYRHEIGFKDTPNKPGVYILHPRPDQDEDVEKFLWRIYERGNTGVYVDEAFMMPKTGAYQSILTQGRSKRIPMINLTQKPRYVPMHVFSEADYHSVFHLSDAKDRQRVMEFTDFSKDDLEREIPEYHSHFYRVKDRQRFQLKPVPSADSLLETFARRLAPKRRFL